MLQGKLGAQQLAEDQWRQRRMVGTTTPYVPFSQQPLSTDYRYLGPPMLGPYRQAWQGVQKINGVATVGTFWARFQLLNLTAQRATSTHIQKNNPMARYVGPGIMTGPTEASASLLQPGQKSSTFGARILAKLTGG